MEVYNSKKKFRGSRALNNRPVEEPEEMDEQVVEEQVHEVEEEPQEEEDLEGYIEILKEHQKK